MVRSLIIEFNSYLIQNLDITVGDNRCAIQLCCESGYGAVTGWDAAVSNLMLSYPAL